MMNRKKWSISEKLLLLTPLLFAVIGGAAYYAPKARSVEALLEILRISTPETVNRTTCQTNLKRMSLATMQYVQDYDERFPFVNGDKVSFGWADSLQPYLMSTVPLHCPRNPQIAALNSAASGYTDFYFNKYFSGLNRSFIESEAKTVMFGEGTSSNARYAKTQLPPPWLKQPSSPTRRHFKPKSATLNGANYAFADGHVKWLQPQQVGTAPAQNGGFTFSTQ